MAAVRNVPSVVAFGAQTEDRVMGGASETTGTHVTLRRARRMQQMISVMQRVAARLGMEDTALALDLASAGAEVDIERILDGEAKRRLSA